MKLRMLNTYSEDLLIKRCQERDRKAQRELYERFAPNMMALCKRYVKHQETAEDVLSTSMVKVFKNIATVESSTSLQAWVRKITVNECLNHLRSEREFTALEVEEDITESNDHDPHEFEELQVMVERLPTGYRTVFNMYAVEGYSHKEISEELRITENASRSQLTKARKQLKFWLDQREKRSQNGR